MMDPLMDFLTDIEPFSIYDDVSGIILAGGRATRFNGQDKGLIALNGKTLVQHAIKRLRPQVDNIIIISANRHIKEYEQYGYRVVSDKIPGFLGPLSGVYSCLEYILKPYAIVVPCDVPFFPRFLVLNLMDQLNKTQSDIAVASVKINEKEVLQPTFMLLKTNLKEDLGQFLKDGGHKIRDFFNQHKFVSVLFNDASEFENINDNNDLQRIMDIKC